MTGWLKRLLPPTAPPVRGIPKAIIQAAVLGVIIGPVMGIFFGWSGPVHAAIVSATYCVVFYTLCALPAGYLRKYPGLTNLVGIAVASLVLIAFFDPYPFQLQDIQVPLVLIMLTLAWAYVV